MKILALHMYFGHIPFIIYVCISMKGTTVKVVTSYLFLVEKKHIINDLIILCVLQVLLQIADDFIEQVVFSSCQIAKHRK